jgi:hypothetical protein
MKPPLPACQPPIVYWQVRVSTCSKPEEIGNCDEHNSDRNEQNRVGYEVGKDHQGQATDQRDNSPLFAAIDEKAKAD